MLWLLVTLCRSCIWDSQNHSRDEWMMKDEFYFSQVRLWLQKSRRWTLRPDGGGWPRKSGFRRQACGPPDLIRLEIPVFGANLWVALGTQPSVKALVIDGGMFCFPRGIWQCLNIFLMSWWGWRRDFFVDGSTQLYQSWLCSAAITENPQITVAIPVLSRYEQLIIYLQNLSQNLRNSFSLLQKQTSTSLLLSKLPQNLKNQPNRVILKSGLFKIVTY